MHSSRFGGRAPPFGLGEAPVIVERLGIAKDLGKSDLRLFSLSKPLDDAFYVVG